MKNYRFELTFRLHKGEDPGQYEDPLFEAGCGDGSLGIGKLGYLGVMFNRAAASAENAIQSAIQNVKTAIPHAVVESIGPFLLNITDIAIRYDTTKANISKYVNGKDNKRGSKQPFPLPIFFGGSDMWYALDVVKWLKSNTKMDISDAEIEVLNVIHQLNIIWATQKCEPIPGIDQLARNIAA